VVRSGEGPIKKRRLQKGEEHEQRGKV